MAIAEKILMLVCLFGGFWWIRERARILNLENRMGRTMLGVFVVLPALLIGEKYIFDHWHFGAYTDLLLKAGAALATFAAVGFLFLRQGNAAEEQGEIDSKDSGSNT